jgi:AGZA family xanthine/uracil permease-like MFS transporter
MGSKLDSFFKVSERGSTIGTEVRAGVATFLVMAYILFVNANILSEIGLSPAAVAAATALIAGLLCIAMGVISNYPIAMAAGLGINAAVAFGLVFGRGLSPEGAMGVIVLEGVVVTILVLVGLREAVMNAVPASLKYAIGVGIGLFILFIGFTSGGLIEQGAGTPVTFVFPNTAGALVTLLGLLITIVLWVRKMKGAMIISIVATTLLALWLDVAQWPDKISAQPEFDTLFIGLKDLGNVFDVAGFVPALLIIFTFMLTDFFDTMGTATAIVEQAELVDEDGSIPDVGKLLLVDSIGAAVGGAAGVSSNTSYIESSAGVAEGGRTGLTVVVTGILFLISIFLSPLALVVPAQATAPVLILVGFLMIGLLKEIDFTDMEEGFPAMLAIILMPLTFSITVGIAAGFVMHTLIKIVKGKASEIHVLMWVVSGACVIFFAQGYLGTLL